MAKDLEAYKTKLSKKEHISKVRFDAEFEIYRALSKAFFAAYAAVNQIAPCGQIVILTDEEAQKDREKNQWINAHNLCVDAQNTLNENAPFITLEIHAAYSEILCTIQSQIIYAAEHPNLKVEEIPADIVGKTQEIGAALEKVNSMIYATISNYEII